MNYAARRAFIKSTSQVREARRLRQAGRTEEMRKALEEAAWQRSRGLSLADEVSRPLASA